MCAQERKAKFGVIIAVVVFALTALTGFEAAAQDDVEVNYKARAISALSIERAASDIFDVRVERWSTNAERDALVTILESKGNHALAAALNEQTETGFARFDPRGGRGPGRDPRKTTLRYAKEIDRGDTKEVILITNVYIGFGSNAQGADGAKLAEYPLSFVLFKFHKDENGGWQKGVGRLFVGAKVRFDHIGNKFTIDEFPTDPVYLKDVTVK
jgi:hypothetical protein